MLFFFRKFNGFILFKNQKFLIGFTLIELLIVIAIIGLLASIASVAALNVRNKGKDAGIMADLAQVRVEAVMIKNATGTYAGLCDPSDNTLNDTDYPNTLGLIEEGIRKYSGSDPTCYAATDAYCAQSALATLGDYCLDSTGIAGTSPAACDSTADCATD
ncbi:prepilin-type N-terminal cleavage/methylation domain-containing protein [Patescibacteria group bacterium]|nr:prepilin-type N-terminal cleavage/methylation domain-containing protein [Patescibacteria group bacterium]